MVNSHSSPNEQSPEAIIRQLFGAGILAIDPSAGYNFVSLQVTFDPSTKSTDQNYVSSIVVCLNDIGDIIFSKTTNNNILRNSIDSNRQITQALYVLDPQSGKPTEKRETRLSDRQKQEMLKAINSVLSELYPAMRQIAKPVPTPVRPKYHEQQVQDFIDRNQRRLG